MHAVMRTVDQHYNMLCASGPNSVHFAEAYLDTVDFISITYVGLAVYDYCLRGACPDN